LYGARARLVARRRGGGRAGPARRCGDGLKLGKAGRTRFGYRRRLLRGWCCWSCDGPRHSWLGVWLGTSTGAGRLGLHGFWMLHRRDRLCRRRQWPSRYRHALRDGSRCGRRSWHQGWLRRRRYRGFGRHGRSRCRGRRTPVERQFLGQGHFGCDRFSGTLLGFEGEIRRKERPAPAAADWTGARISTMGAGRHSAVKYVETDEGGLR
jgi:hypothetical protein